MNHGDCPDNTRGALGVRGSLNDNTIIVSVRDDAGPQEVQLPAGEYNAQCVFPTVGAAGAVLVQLQGVPLVDPAALIATAGTETRTSGFVVTIVTVRRFQVSEETRVQVTALTAFGGAFALVTFERLSPGGGL